jgi:tetratricopeptide (TPR) repeat protein
MNASRKRPRQQAADVRRLVGGGLLLVSLGLFGALPVAAESLPPPHTASAEPMTPTDIVLPVPADLSPTERHIGIAESKIGSTSSQHKNTVVRAMPAGKEGYQPLIARAHALLEAKDYDRALALYGQVLAADRGNHAALAGKAYALAQSGKDDAAVETGRRLLTLYPHDDAANVNLAHILMRRGKNEEAIACLDRAARDAPDRIAYRLDLAALYDRAGHGAEALALYRQVIDEAEKEEAPALSVPLPVVRQRAAYLEMLGGAADNEPSTTAPDSD